MPQTTNIPAVPLTTPMFDDPKFTSASGNLARTWYIFFETVRKAIASGAGGPYIRTLLIKDATIGSDIADHVPVWVDATATRLIGVLRKAITADLTVRVNLNGTALITLNIPHATLVDTPVVSTGFVSTSLADLSILSWDITNSDGTKDADGIASFTLQFS